MREKFESQLNKLNDSLITMGNAISERVEMSVHAMIDQDKTIAQQVIDGDDEIDEMYDAIEKRAMKIILQQQPVARDLRLVTASQKMIIDMERISDQASDISQIAFRMADFKIIKTKQLDDLREMSLVAMEMVRESVQAFVTGDLSLVDKVRNQDNVVDDYFVKIKNQAITFLTTPGFNPEVSIDILLIAKYLERIGDHAENIAEWVQYSITGRKH